ncbi:hypothetical protein F8388_018112 [Cannabis sativa]|uniref:Reverse transcriptase zinc-binding domain-containing protein n=1 Tax=Cannabis sativa TaxID=3483 RepID=A0A7J6DKE3_CANSA|nr:hypothetical protein G4B88_015250 [Cannabis sativa]KAF4395838.1 hypothetical protein F8388_018112 [Cannabis sativa]
MVKKWFNRNDAKAIVNIQLPKDGVKDDWMWMGEPSGLFSIKSSYRVVRGGTTIIPAETKWKMIWNSTVHPRLKLIWWQLERDAFPTEGKLAKFMELNNVYCPVCGEEMETIFHLMWKCTLAKVIWFNSSMGIRVDRVDVNDWEHWKEWFLVDNYRPPNISVMEIIVTALWEALAVCMAAELMVERMIEHVVFQSDNMDVVKAFSTEAERVINLKLVHIRRRFHQLCRRFNNWGIGHVPRRCNFTAHNIAKWEREAGVTGITHCNELDHEVLNDYIEWKRHAG